jgi:hypothetical protein
MHAEIIDKALAGNFVVGFEDVVYLLDDVLDIRHRMALYDIFEADNGAMFTILESFRF